MLASVEDRCMSLYHWKRHFPLNLRKVLYIEGWLKDASLCAGLVIPLPDLVFEAPAQFQKIYIGQVQLHGWVQSQKNFSRLSKVYDTSTNNVKCKGGTSKSVADDLL